MDVGITGDLTGPGPGMDIGAGGDNDRCQDLRDL